MFNECAPALVEVILAPLLCDLFVDSMRSMSVKLMSLNAWRRKTPHTIVRNPHTAPIMSPFVSFCHSWNRIADAIIVRVVNMT